MKLIRFRVQNYRSINDSGDIEVTARTALVGRNESGKTNLLLALQSLNPPGRKLQALSDVRDYPNDRPLSRFSDNTNIVNTTWQLSADERKKLAEIFPRAKTVKEVTVGRSYKAERQTEFVDLAELDVDYPNIKETLTRVKQSVKRSLQSHAETAQTIKVALDQLGESLKEQPNPHQWSVSAIKAVNDFRSELGAANMEISDTLSQHLSEIHTHATALQGDSVATQAAKKWVEESLPIFIFLDEYPELDGHQHIPQYLDKSRQRTPQEQEAEKNFGKLMKVAGLDAAHLNQLLSNDHERRGQLTNRSGAVVTNEIRRLWKDRTLKVYFRLDGEHFDTMISDPTASYEVEINLNQRSRGFKWFFSFYITFSADTAGGDAKNAILLLDEPGLFLHAKGQQDLLDHFAQDFANQIIYTTHSPFMVPVDDIGSVRTVNTEEKIGTTVTNNPTGDERTLFPLRSALGYELAQSLFIGELNLVVEGVSDYWYLSSISEHIRDTGGNGLPADLVITPSGGAQKIPYMVSLLASQKLRVLVLLDEETEARQTALEDLVKQKLLRQNYIMFISEALLPRAVQETDIEDLIDTATYDELVQATYAKELAGKKLSLNTHIPRIVKRYETAFEALGLVFHKTRPAKLFLRTVGSDPNSVVTPTTQGNFANLFKIISERLNQQLQATHRPFE